MTPEQACAIADVFVTTFCTAKRHRRRVDMIRDIERQSMTGSTTSGGGVELSADDLQRIADRVRQILQQQGAGRLRPPPPVARRRSWRR